MQPQYARSLNHDALLNDVLLVTILGYLVNDYCSHFEEA